MSATAWPVRRARFTDVPHLLRQVVEAAQEGHLNPAYTDWRYQIGLAKSMFATLLLGRHKDEQGRWLRARLRVIRPDKLPIGFCMVHDGPVPDSLELYLVCVDRPHRGQGCGRALVLDACARLGPQQAMLVLTLSRNTQMAAVLTQAGAQALGEVRMGHGEHVPIQAYGLGAPAAVAALKQSVGA